MMERMGAAVTDPKVESVGAFQADADPDPFAKD